MSFNDIYEDLSEDFGLVFFGTTNAGNAESRKLRGKNLEAKGKKILLSMDNCEVHFPDVELRNISLLYFPANTISKSQINFGLYCL